jgi:cytochrome c-type biogenesis protein CcmF
MIEYIGEHLWIGQIGQFLVFLAFCSAILSTVSYSFGSNEQVPTAIKNWRRIARIAFITHGVSIILVILLIFYMMIMKHYEYDYVWSHVSNTLAFKYTFAAFWEGQEGSFLLWMFWHSILGFILIKTAGKWEQPVMAVLSFVQIFFVFFILGLYFDGGDPAATSYSFLGNIYGRSGFVWLLFTLLFYTLYRKNNGSSKVLFKYLSFTPSILLLCLIFGGCYHLGEVRLGGSPFMLMRDVHFAPIFNSANYMQSESMQNGTGLNPLLQNYWMTIHPPTLFLGFATTIVPAAYAIAGLWKGAHKEWMEPALKWALISAAILGTGILMGGVWAYEALSFGGYWAWDPVENASLVPWIILVAGIHTTLVARTTNYSTKSSYIFYILCFLLIVYSTFLTRSGILGETSVHAFTEMGLEWQLLLFMGTLVFLSIGFYKYRSKEIPVPPKEESGISKEFWMFVGSLVLLFSAGLITITTSIPVINAVSSVEPFATFIDGGKSLFSGFENTTVLSSIYHFFEVLDSNNIAPPDDVVDHHNNFQLWIAILVALLSGFVQFLRFKESHWGTERKKSLLKYIGGAAILAFLLSLPATFGTGLMAFQYLNVNTGKSAFLAGPWQYWLLIICAFFTIVTNLSYLIFILKNKLKLAGSVFSHVGFGIMLIGVVYSGAMKYAISDPFASKELDGILGDLNKQTNKNILVPKGQSISLSNGYSVTYTNNWSEGNAIYYELSFLKKDKNGAIIDRFTTIPNVLHDTLANGNLKFRAANPNTKHYLTEDVFTLAVPHWAFEDPEAAEEKDTSQWIAKHIAIGDTFYTNRYYVVYDRNNIRIPERDDFEYQDGDILVTAQLDIRDINSNESVNADVLYYIRQNNSFSLPTKLPEQGLEFRLTNIIPAKGKVVLQYRDKQPKRDYVVVQALIFPGIQLVWLGCILMMFGLLLGGINRVRNSKKNQKNS